MCAVSRKQHCVTLSTTEVECMAMVEGVEGGLSVRSALSLMQPGVAFPIGSPLNYLKTTRGPS